MNDRRSMQTRSNPEKGALVDLRGAQAQQKTRMSRFAGENEQRDQLNPSVANVGYPSHPNRSAIASQQWSVKGGGKERISEPQVRVPTGCNGQHDADCSRKTDAIERSVRG